MLADGDDGRDDHIMGFGDAFCVKESGLAKEK